MNLRTFVRIALTVTMAVAAEGAYSQVSVYPSSPKMLETVRVKIAQGAIEPMTQDNYDLRATRVSMAGSRITVTVVDGGRGLNVGEPSPPIDQPLGQFPAGQYEVEVRVEDRQGALLKTVGTTTFSVMQRVSGEPTTNMTDLWWVPEESGWGLNIVQHGSGTIFATWFVYDADNEPAWYVMPGGQWISGQYGGTLYRTSGPDFCYTSTCAGLPFDPSMVTRTPVGIMVISPNPYDYDRAMLNVEVNGKSLPVRYIQRQPF